MSPRSDGFATEAALALADAEVLRDAGNRSHEEGDAAAWRYYRGAAALFRFAAENIRYAGYEAGTGYDPNSARCFAEADRLDALAREIEGGGK